MLTFVQNWFAPKANPIGIDFGTDSLRLAQVQLIDNEHHLVAAASTDVPPHVRHDAAARWPFFIDAVRDLLAGNNFRGRQCVLSLPAAMTFIQHLRLPRMDAEATRKAIPWEARGKLPIDPSRALIRHVIAGELYHDQEPRNEVVLMAAARDLVNQYLSAAAHARLDVVGMNVEARAIVDCFSHVYRRKTDTAATNCFVDIGCTASRAIISRAGLIHFARIIPIGSEHLTRAVASAFDLSFDNARLLRFQLAQAQPSMDEHREQRTLLPAPSEDNHAFPLLDSALQNAAAVMPRAVPADQDRARQVDQACRETLNHLVEELDLCRRYHESTFPDKPLDRLIFVGGEARQRSLCQHIAREMQLAAQIGDPMVRMARNARLDPDCGLDRRQPQPEWTVAIGLSMGPATPEEQP